MKSQAQITAIGLHHLKVQLKNRFEGDTLLNANERTKKLVVRLGGSLSHGNKEYKFEGYLWTTNLPNYLKNMAAIQDAVKKLPSSSQCGFHMHLQLIVLGHSYSKLDAVEQMKMLLATPKQWCEAYLKAIGKWIDKPKLKVIKIKHSYSKYHYKRI